MEPAVTDVCTAANAAHTRLHAAAPRARRNSAVSQWGRLPSFARPPPPRLRLGSYRGELMAVDEARRRGCDVESKLDGGGPHGDAEEAEEDFLPQQDQRLEKYHRVGNSRMVYK